MEKKELLPYKRKAAYYETDQMKIIHHSNYIRWFEETRVDMLEQMGVPYSLMEEKGIISPVLFVHCEYKTPVRFDDEVLITGKIVSFTGLKFEVEYEIKDSKTGELRVTGKTGHCFVDENMIPLRLKKKFPDIYEVFESYVEKS